LPFRCFFRFKNYSAKFRIQFGFQFKFRFCKLANKSAVIFIPFLSEILCNQFIVIYVKIKCFISNNFTRSIVEFFLNFQQSFSINFIEVSSLREVSFYESICVLIRASFPGRVRMCKENFHICILFFFTIM